MTHLNRLQSAAIAVLSTDFAKGAARLADETDKAAHGQLRAALAEIARDRLTAELDLLPADRARGDFGR